MRYSRAFIPTLKEVPADAQVASHIFLVRGGFIRRLSAGVYNLLPLGWRVVRKIEQIVREEMDRAGAQEILMPSVVPAELWKETGRWTEYGPLLLRMNDRKGAEFCFGPTHEEVVVDIVRREIRSYRDLPLNLYQIQGKFRDELRPRAGLLRGREFIMKDAYSFHASAEQASEEYRRMYAAYERIFSRCGLEFRVVEADTGAIGGKESHEFQVLAESGEDTIVACSACDYAANTEQAELRAPSAPGITVTGGVSELEKVSTPGTKTIDEVAGFLNIPASQLIKTLIYMADAKPVAVLVRGDRAVNEVAVKKVTGAVELFLAREGQVVEVTGAPSGFAGPIGLSIPVYADAELEGATGAVTGANEADAHLRGVDLARDAKVQAFAQLPPAEAGDSCARCGGGRYEVLRGIEVGHVFNLGTKYSKPMEGTVLDESGQARVMEMGCYGIGITRVASAAIEQHHDESGIVWPMSIAPYEVALLPLQMGDDAVREAAEALYRELLAAGVEVLYDDRDERPGAKFKDADLIGVPLRLALGKRSVKEGNLELKWRRDAEASSLPLAGAAEAVAQMVADEKRSYGARADERARG
jgi:prolyl-tRNA synthetase